MKKITTIIMFVLCGLLVQAQYEPSYCNPNPNCKGIPDVFIFLVTKDNIPEASLIEQYSDVLKPIYETYNFKDYHASGIYEEEKMFEVDGCGDEEQAQKDLESTNLFEYIEILHIVEMGFGESIEAANAFNVNNPVFNELNLVLPNKTNEIKIFDIQGKTVLQTECGETASINVSMLPKGVYTLVVNNSGSQKFVKE